MNEINPRMGNYNMEKKEDKRWFDMQKIKLPRNCYIIPLSEWTDKEIVQEWFNRMINLVEDEHWPSDEELREEIKKRANGGNK